MAEQCHGASIYFSAKEWADLPKYEQARYSTTMKNFNELAALGKLGLDLSGIGSRPG